MARETADNYRRNNLDAATSPYLRQHRDNPVWWQEWSRPVLDHARREDKPLFVSVGYATCHWCHVMAEDTFSDSQCARFLNEHFVSIKVDREQRPDIDQFMMSFLVATQGSGGWPLNVFLSPELSPFFATTYLGSKATFGRPSFLDVLSQILDFYVEKREALRENRISLPADSGDGESAVDEAALASRAKAIADAADRRFGGFGSSQKFPPHSTLLYGLLEYAANGRDEVAEVVTNTLDSMAQRGLHDHLQGGFFRYCVDREWTIPHFEKMLYDQAMLLWAYSVAADVHGRDDYAAVAEGIVRCLEETFRYGDAYVSAHDADTDHEEGATYLFTLGDLDAVLSEEELSILAGAFEITEEGNFNEPGADRSAGLNHLVRRTPFGRNPDESAVLEKLLTYRKDRPQPTVDTKIVTSWNCLAAVGLIEAGRRLSDPSLGARAEEIEQFILEYHYADGRLVHSSNEGRIQHEEFLEDVAAFFLLETYLLEERQFADGGSTRARCRTLSSRLADYRSEDSWIEARNEDFMEIPAQGFDSPTPSSISLAILAESRWAQLSGRIPSVPELRAPLSNDFHNFGAVWSSGYVHEVHAPTAIPASELPPNTILIRDEETQDCYKGVCRRDLPERSTPR